MNRTNQVAIVAGLLISSLGYTLPAAGQQVYRAVDDLGNPAFTDRPEEYTAAEAFSIEAAAPKRKKIVQQTAAVAKTDGDDSNNDIAAQIRSDQAAEDAAAAAAKQEQQADAQASNCANATKRFDKYKSARRLYRQAGDGERQYLTDDELDSARVEAKRSVDKWCGS